MCHYMFIYFYLIILCILSYANSNTNVRDVNILANQELTIVKDDADNCDEPDNIITSLRKHITGMTSDLDNLEKMLKQKDGDGGETSVDNTNDLPDNNANPCNNDGQPNNIASDMELWQKQIETCKEMLQRHSSAASSSSVAVAPGGVSSGGTAASPGAAAASPAVSSGSATASPAVAPGSSATSASVGDDKDDKLTRLKLALIKNKNRLYKKLDSEVVNDNKVVRTRWSNWSKWSPTFVAKIRKHRWLRAPLPHGQPSLQHIMWQRKANSLQKMQRRRLSSRHRNG